MMNGSTRRGGAISAALVLRLAFGAGACDDPQESESGDDCTQDVLSGFDDTLVFTSAYQPCVHG